RLWNNAFALLRYLGMIDDADQITEWGRRAYDVPLHPRHAAVFLSAVDAGKPVIGAFVSALINEGFLLRNIHFASDRRRCDVHYQLEILKAVMHREELSSTQLLQSIDQRRVASVIKLARMLID